MEIGNVDKYLTWLRSVLKFDEGLDEETFERVWSESLVKKYDQGDIGRYTLSKFFTRTGEDESIRYRVKKGSIVF